MTSTHPVAGETRGGSLSRTSFLMLFLLAGLLFTLGTPHLVGHAEESAATDAPAAAEDAEEAQENDEALSRRELEQLVDRLGSAEAEERERAYERLVDAGEAAIPVLERAVRRTNPEIRWRAEKALELCRWGITTELSEVEAQLSAFLASPVSQRLSYLNRWSSNYGRALVPFLRNICLRDPSRVVRERAFSQILRVGRLNAETLQQLAERITRNDAGAGWAWIALARHYLEEEHFDEAVPCLERVMRMDPTNYDAHDMLARIHVRREQWEEAAHYHRLARELGRDDESRLRHAEALADILLDLGRFDEAQSALEWLLESGNRTPATILTLLRFYFQHEMLERADALAEETLEQWRGRSNRSHYLLQLLQLLVHALHERGEYARMAECAGEMIETIERLISERRLFLERSYLIPPLLGYAWALRHAGEVDEAAATLRRVGDFVNAETLHGMYGAMRLAERWREFEVLDELHDRVSAISPVRAHLLRANMVLFERRDYQRARELLERADEEVLRDLGAVSVPTLMLMLSAWDAVGDERIANRYIDWIVSHDDFHTAYFSARNLAGEFSASSDMVLYESWAANAGISRQQMLVRRLAHDGQFEAALRLARRIQGRADLDVTIAQLLVALEKPEEALAHLEERMGANPRPQMLEAAARIHFEELGQFDAALALLDGAVADLSQTETGVHRLRSHLRLGHYHTVIAEASDALEHAPETGARVLALRLLKAQATWHSGEVALARREARALLDSVDAWHVEERRPGSVSVRHEVFEAARILCDLGQARHVLERFRPSMQELLQPMLRVEQRIQLDDWGRLRYVDQSEDPVSRGERLQHVLACAYAHETLEQPVEALVAYLLAWRLAYLDYHTDFILKRLTPLATPQHLAEVCAHLENELVPRLGVSLRNGGAPQEMRHSRTMLMRMLAHARALNGDLTGAAAVLRFVVEHADTHDIPAFEHISSAVDERFRGFNEEYSVDFGVELVQLKLHPERTAGLSEARAAALLTELGSDDDENRARIAAGLELCDRLLTEWPNEMRLHALRIRAAELLDVADEHEGAQASQARIDAAYLLDEWDTYTAAFHFLQHNYDTLSEMLWRSLIEIESASVHIRANAFEYLGRLLDRDPSRRQEAAELLLESDRLIALENWIIDEDGHEGLTHHARRMRTRAEQAINAGNDDATAALAYAKRASAYWPANPQLRLFAARLMAEQGHLDEAHDWLRPLHVTTSLRLQTAPHDPHATQLRHAIDRIPGIHFEPIPQPDNDEEDESEPGD